MSADKYHQAAERAVEWCLEKQDPNGSIPMEVDCLDSFYKWPLAFMSMGRYVEAAKLLNWIEKKLLKPDGDFSFPERKVLGPWNEYLDLYINSWIAMGAQKAGFFRLADRAVRFILKRQSPSTGQFRTGTPNAAIACLHAGRLFEACRAADAMCSVVDQHPQDDPVFYFRLDETGRVITDFPQDEALFFHLHRDKTDQLYWCPAIGAALLCHVYELTDRKRYLGCAMKIFEFLSQCSDSLRVFGSGKVGYTASLLYRATGNDTYKQAALEYLDWLISIQKPEGHWSRDVPDSPWYGTWDATGEFIYWISEILRITASVQSV